MEPELVLLCMLRHRDGSLSCRSAVRPILLHGWMQNHWSHLDPELQGRKCIPLRRQRPMPQPQPVWPGRHSQRKSTQDGLHQQPAVRRAQHSGGQRVGLPQLDPDRPLDGRRNVHQLMWQRRRRLHPKRTGCPPVQRDTGNLRSADANQRVDRLPICIYGTILIHEWQQRTLLCANICHKAETGFSDTKTLVEHRGSFCLSCFQHH